MFRLVRLPLLTHCLEDNSKGVCGCMYIMYFGMYIFVCVCVCERGAGIGRGNSKHFFFQNFSSTSGGLLEILHASLSISQPPFLFTVVENVFEHSLKLWEERNKTVDDDDEGQCLLPIGWLYM